MQVARDAADIESSGSNELGQQVLRELKRISRALASAQAELLDADGAAKLSGMSRASWWRLNSAERCPAAIKLAGKTLWRRSELLAWIAASCPTRQEWESLRGQKQK